MALREKLLRRTEKSNVASRNPAEIEEADTLWVHAEREIRDLKPNSPVYLIIGDGKKPTHIVSARTTEQWNKPSFTGVNAIDGNASPAEWAGMVGMAQARIAKRERRDTPIEATLLYSRDIFPGDTLQNIYFYDVRFAPSSLQKPSSVISIEDRDIYQQSAARVNLVVV